MKSRRSQKVNPLKDPNEPQKPPKAYIRYARTVWEKVQADNPGLNIGNIGKYIGAMWRGLPDCERDQFIQEAQLDMNRYEEDMRQYQSSPAYRDWQRRSELARVEKEREATAATNSSHTKDPATMHVQQGALEKSLKKEVWPDYSFLQAELESDEEMDYNEWKVESAQRFYRNHALMQELYSVSPIRDLEAVTHSTNPFAFATDSELVRVLRDTEQTAEQHSSRMSAFKERNQRFKHLVQQQDSRLYSLMQQCQQQTTAASSHDFQQPPVLSTAAEDAALPNQDNDTPPDLSMSA